MCRTQECEAARLRTCSHGREPVGMKADSFRAAPTSIVSTVATLGGAGADGHPRGGEREENVPTRELVSDADTLTPRRVMPLPLSTRTFCQRTIARHRAK